MIEVYTVEEAESLIPSDMVEQGWHNVCYGKVLFRWVSVSSVVRKGEWYLELCREVPWKHDTGKSRSDYRRLPIGEFVINVEDTYDIWIVAKNSALRGMIDKIALERLKGRVVGVTGGVTDLTIPDRAAV